MTDDLFGQLDMMMDIMDHINSCDSDFCPPPLFDVPAPPPPPFLDTPLAALCGGNCDSSSSGPDSLGYILQSIVVIVISSLIIVISLLLGAVFLWR